MRLISTKKAAEKLGTCEATVRNWCVDGLIRAVKFGRSWKITQEEIDYVIKHGTREPEGD